MTFPRNAGFLQHAQLVNKQLLPGLLVDSADYHPEKELFPGGNARGNN